MSHVVISIYDDEANPHYGGGGAVIVSEIARRLAVHHQVTVISGSFRGSRSHVADGVRRVYLPVGWAGPRLGQLLFHSLLPALSALVRHDLWIESLTPPFSTSFLPLFSRRPVLALVQMLTAEDATRRYKLPFDVIERRGIRLYRNFVVLNDIDRAVIEAQSSHPQVTVIPNAIYLPPESTHHDGDYILFLGRIDVRQKGLDLLLDAYDRSNSAFPLLLAGGGRPAEQRRLMRLTREVRGPVHWLGPVTGLAKQTLLRNCAFVVVPSRYETFGLSALEAMASSRPVVHFDLPRLRWISPDCSVRVTPFDVNELAAAMRLLSSDPSRRSAMGRAGRDASARFNWDAVGRQYREVVEDLLRREVGRARGGRA